MMIVGIESSEQESFVEEECTICRESLTTIKDIWVDVDSDNYVCRDCAEEHKLHVVRCIEL